MNRSKISLNFEKYARSSSCKPFTGSDAAKTEMKLVKWIALKLLKTYVHTVSNPKKFGLEHQEISVYFFRSLINQT